MSETTLLWLRRDLRLADHPALVDAVRSGPVVPVWIFDPVMYGQLGAAPRWRMGEALRAMAAALEDKGSRLILRRGDALAVLRALVADTGAARVVWSRLYDQDAIERDKAIKAALTEDGIEVRSFNGSLLFEPWTVETGQGGMYRVYTPFWKAVSPRDVDTPVAEPGQIPAPATWPESDRIGDWHLDRPMNRGGAVVARFARIGERAARDALGRFLEDGLQCYKSERDRTDREGCSGLSENLTYGEISPRTVWHAAAEARDGFDVTNQARQAEHFLKEVVWREFAYHLLYHTPRLATGNWREEWDDFPWQDENPEAERWRRGMTGIEMVDAAMREMYVTGRMHNRCRMLVASFLTKHLMTHWKIGAEWFRDCLIDWDIAANAMGWQWTAGSGPDAAPYFRVFNPDLQADKFDPKRAYRDRFLAEGRREPHADALAYFQAVPRSWGLSPDQTYPAPVIALKEGRQRALAAYEKRRKAA